MNNTHIEQPKASSAQPEMICTPSGADQVALARYIEERYHARHRDDHAVEQAEICRITGGPSLPEDACGSWARLYADLAVFLEDLHEHIRLENHVLFPQFEPTV